MARRGSFDFTARLGMELVIVLLGVLLAFQFEGWRERRAELDRELMATAGRTPR